MLNLEEDEIRKRVEDFQLWHRAEPSREGLRFFDALNARLLIIRAVLDAEAQEAFGERVDVPDWDVAANLIEQRVVRARHQTEAQPAHAEIFSHAANHDEVRKLGEVV